MLRITTLLAGLLALSACAQPKSSAPTASQEQLHQEQTLHLQALNTNAHAAGMRTRFTDSELAAMQQRLQYHAARIQQAGQSLCRHLNRDPLTCTYRFQLEADAEALNAYADGQTIMITPTMMHFTNDNELGVVLGHEYAHNLMGHVQSSQQNALLGFAIGSVGDWFAASKGVDTGGELGNAGANIGMQAFSPEFETEADYVGLYVALWAGYDVNTAAAFWQKMTLVDPEGAFTRGTHPANHERSAMLRNTATEMYHKHQKGQQLLPSVEGL